MVAQIRNYARILKYEIEQQIDTDRTHNMNTITPLTPRIGKYGISITNDNNNNRRTDKIINGIIDRE